MTSTLLCLGYGYVAQHLAARLSGRCSVWATTRTPKPAVQGLRWVSLEQDDLSAVTHILVSAPPQEQGDPFLPLLPALPQLRWVGYLSATSVYGDHAGAWVDEQSPTHPTSANGIRRLAAEQQWLNSGLPVQIFRLSGIYGRGRNVLAEVQAGTSRRWFKPNHAFSRIHVADIAAALDVAMFKNVDNNIFNLADDEPAPQADVVSYAATLLGLPVPPLEPYDAAELSPMAQGFWRDNKRIANKQLKELLLPTLLYPTYREGLQACV